MPKQKVSSQNVDTSNLISVEEVCVVFNLTRTGLYARMRSRGRPQTIKVGRRVYFNREILTGPLSLPG
jgi:predicted DNA-binding transcriptional regulator AlpA